MAVRRLAQVVCGATRNDVSGPEARDLIGQPDAEFVWARRVCNLNSPGYWCGLFRWRTTETEYQVVMERMRTTGIRVLPEGLSA